MFNSIYGYIAAGLIAVILTLSAGIYTQSNKIKELESSLAVTSASLNICHENSEKQHKSSEIKDQTLIELSDKNDEINNSFEELNEKFKKLEKRKCTGVGSNVKSNTGDTSELNNLGVLLNRAACIANSDCKPSETPPKPL